MQNTSKKISETLTEYQIKHINRQKHCNSKKKRFWTQKQDKILLEGVKKYGSKKWSKISKLLKKRNPKRCRQRWFNYLKQQNKEWNHSDLWILYLSYRVYGRKWAQISKILNRGDNVIKNKVNCLKQSLIDQFQDKINMISKGQRQIDFISNLQKKLLQNIINLDNKSQYSKPIVQQNIMVEKQQNPQKIQTPSFQVNEWNNFNFQLLTHDIFSNYCLQPYYQFYNPNITYWANIGL